MLKLTVASPFDLKAKASSENVQKENQQSEDTVQLEAGPRTPSAIEVSLLPADTRNL